MEFDLRKIFIDCWREIKQIYEQGTIVGEHHLQTELYSLLKPKLEPKGYKIYVESGLKEKNIDPPFFQGKVPDLVVCNEKQREIVGVVEIKYVPWTSPRFIPDFYKFHLINVEVKKKHTNKVLLKVNPINGNWNRDFTYKFNESVDFIYVVVGRANSKVFGLEKVFEETMIHKVKDIEIEIKPAFMKRGLFLYGKVVKDSDFFWGYWDGKDNLIN